MTQNDSVATEIGHQLALNARLVAAETEQAYQKGAKEGANRASVWWYRGLTSLASVTALVISIIVAVNT